ncbi:GtrA family protein [Epibacterium ulvae]|uniref:GtrA family protein n=1 Tax=Epibacterium ulvae TaxID=1156985 RepID=UPI002493B5B8|nr:GtrA family protein [Epibacterium ulvae]
MKTLFQIIRFCIVGGAATMLHYGIAISMLMLDMAVFWANWIGFLSAFGLGFVGHVFFTFHDCQTRKLSALTKYAFVSITSFLCGQSLLAVAMLFYRMPDDLALSLVIILTATLNFVLSRNWAFAVASRSGKGAD